MNMRYIFLYIFTGILLHACIQAPDYPDEPVITYEGVSKTFMNQDALNTDSIFLRFSFTDGDGDLGYAAADTSRNIFIKDLRTGNFQDKFKSPFIPEEGIGNGITGEIELLIYTTCCIFPDKNIPPCSDPEQFPTDTIIYEISMKDRAGNISNTIQSEPIVLRCVK